jgi:hypothetical protein
MALRATHVTPSQNRTTAAVTKKVDCTTGALVQQGPGVVNRDHLGTPAVADGVVQVIGQAQGRNVLTPAVHVCNAQPPYLKFSINIRSSPALTSRSYRIVRSSGDTSNPDGMLA